MRESRARTLGGVSDEDPDCLRCRHHYVTYEADWPHGCRAFALKSRLMPAGVVRESSGRPCQAFEARPRPEDR